MISLTAQKRTTRADARKRMQSASELYLDAGQYIARMIEAENWSPRLVVGGYIGRASWFEIDTSHILSQLHDKGHTLCLPRVTSKNSIMQFHIWTPGDALEKDTLGVLAPTADAPVIVPDIIVTPLVAFDKYGHRLGWGGGFYDIYYDAHCNGPTRRGMAMRDNGLMTLVGIGYDQQEYAELPNEPHDAIFDRIITPTRSILVKNTHPVPWIV